MQAVGVRELKNRLSHYLAEAKRGEVVLVTDRGQVVAEIRKPQADAGMVFASEYDRKIWPYVQSGEIKMGRRPRVKLKYGPTGLSFSDEEIQRYLDEDRAEGPDGG